MEQEEENLEGLLKWAAEVGVSDSAATSEQGSSNSCLGHSLFISYFPDAGGRGLGAVRDIRRGELVLRVPKSALLTRKSLLKDERLSVAVKGHSFLSPVQILAICLLYEMQKGRSSWWYPYLMNLPQSYDILATFGEFEKQALQVQFLIMVDDAIWAAEKAILKAELEWKEANALMKELNLKPRLQTFRAWLWASATISSRTMHIPWDEAGCLCPVGDLFNYAAPGEEPSGFEDLELRSHASSFQGTTSLRGDTTYMLDVEQLDTSSERLTDGCFVEDVAAYCFYARENYKNGEQVLLCYGTYTNLELLEHYGFFLDENPNEKVFIPLEPEIYSSNSWPKESMYIHQSGMPSFSLLSALRLWATQPNQRRSVAHLAYSGCQLSSENEIFVMRWISNKCNVLLKSLPTSFGEDCSILNAIGKMQGLNNPLELRTYMASSTGEIRAFLEANGLQNGEGGAELSFGLQNGEGGAELPLPRKIKRSFERWRLAVEWRLSHKKILVNCISYCAETTDLLTCQKNISRMEDTLI